MGGAAGHVSQMWEATDLTFRQITDILDKISSQELKNVTEKLDGQNIMISYKDGKVIAARSAKELRNFGELAMDVEAMAEYFSKRGNPPSVERSYVEAMNDFQKIFDQLSPAATVNDELWLMFSGKLWLNVEILYEENENVIPYFKNQLRIHHVRHLDEDGQTIKIFTDPLLKVIEDVQRTVKTTYEIKRTNSVKTVLSAFEAAYFNGLINSLMNDFNLNDNNTIADYTEKYVFSVMDDRIIGDLRTQLAKRWGRGDKSTRINVLLKDEPEDIQTLIRSHEERSKLTYDTAIREFKSIFSNIGITVLQQLEGLTTKDPEACVNRIKEKMVKAINHAKINIPNGVESHIEFYEELGGLESIAPTEGIVFEYEGRLLKLTGSFTSQLRIIGFHRFG